MLRPRMLPGVVCLVLMWSGPVRADELPLRIDQTGSPATDAITLPPEPAGEAVDVADTPPPASSAAEPTPVVGEIAVHDFGTVAQGALVQHGFELSNEHARPLHITDVKAPCSCTVAVASDRVIPAGGSVRVDVAFDTAHLQGHKHKTVFVFTDDSEQPVRSLTLTGIVSADLVADPPVVYFGRIDPGADAHAEVRVLASGGYPLDVIAEVEGRTPAIEVGVEPPDGDGETVRRVVVRLGREMQRGPFSESIRIRAVGGRAGEIEVPVLGTIEGDLVVLPPQVTIRPRRAASALRGRRGAGEAVTEVLVRNLGIDPVSISGVRVPDFPLDYAVKAVRLGYEYRITLRLPGLGSTQDGTDRQGLLHIYTTHPDETELVVPVYAMAPPGSW